MSRLAGALLDRQPGPKYAEALRFAEIRPQVPVPNAKTLAKWRSGLPDDFVIALEAPVSTFVGDAGELRIDEGVQDRAAWVKEAAHALGAEHVVVRTTSKITPSRRNRDRLVACFDLIRASGDDTHGIVWDPSGMWEADERAARAKEWGVVSAFDPLLDDPAPDTLAYGRVRTVGARKRISDGLIYEIAQKLSHLPDVRIAIDSPKSFMRATALQALLDAPS